MAFDHGIRGRETPTSILSIVSDGLTPTYVGTAPINMCTKQNINTPILCYSYEEAVKEFGYVNNFDFTLCEAIDLHFSKFGCGPIVLINVLDPKIHKKTFSEEKALGSNGIFTIKKLGVIPSTISLKETFEYETAFDDEGYLIIIPTEKNNKTEIIVSFDALDCTSVDKNDVIGGIDSLTGKKKGLECISQVFPKYRVIPNPILAPKFSTDSTVAAVMETKASKINGHFQSIALIDIDTDSVKKYSDAVKNKNDNNLISTYLDIYYPKVALGDNQYHLSTQAACIMQKLASENEGIPYKSPSNENLKADRTCLADGTDVLLGIDEANYLNGQGINTAVNIIGGWKVWGNRTSCYPSNTDLKDNFIVGRMMSNYIINSLILTLWQKVDDPTNRVLVKTVMDTGNIWLNGLKSSGKILGARIEFRELDNPTTSLIDGKIKFKLFWAPALPGEDIVIDLEIDTNYFKALF